MTERHPVENTPFWIIMNTEGWFLTLGEYRVSQIRPTKSEALAELQEKKWEIIMHLCAVVVEKTLRELEAERIKYIGTVQS